MSSKNIIRGGVPDEFKNIINDLPEDLVSIFGGDGVKLKFVSKSGNNNLTGQENLIYVQVNNANIILPRCILYPGMIAVKNISNGLNTRIYGYMLASGRELIDGVSVYNFNAKGICWLVSTTKEWIIIKYI